MDRNAFRITKLQAIQWLNGRRPIPLRIEIGQVSRLFARISDEEGLLYDASQAVQRDEAGRHPLGAKK
jgi:hypothetical protein